MVLIVPAMLARAVGFFFRGSAELGVKSVAIGEKMLEKQDEHIQILTEFCGQKDDRTGRRQCGIDNPLYVPKN